MCRRKGNSHYAGKSGKYKIIGVCALDVFNLVSRDEGEGNRIYRRLKQSARHPWTAKRNVPLLPPEMPATKSK